MLHCDLRVKTVLAEAFFCAEFSVLQCESVGIRIFKMGT